MRKSSLVSLLYTLNSDQLTKLKDFARSPYHNRKNGVIRLCDFLVEQMLSGGPGELDKEVVWAKVFSKKDFNYTVFKNTVHDLKKITEKFIMTESCMNDEPELYSRLLAHLKNSGDRKLFGSVLDSVDHLRNSPGFGKKFTMDQYYRFMYNYYLHKEHFEGLYLHKSKRGDELKSISGSFLMNFFVSAFELYNVVNIRNVELNTPEENIELAEMLKVLDESGFVVRLIRSMAKNSQRDSRILDLYFKMYRALSNKTSPEDFLKFSEALETAKHYLPQQTLSSLYILLQNSLVNLHVNTLFICTNYLEISDKMIDSGVYLSPDGRLRDQLFVTYVAYACNLGHEKKIKLYTEKYLNHLQESSRESLGMLADAHYEFAAGNFLRSLDISSRIDLHLFPLKYYVKNLQLKIFYELDEYDSFVLSVDSFRHFLSKHKDLFKKHYKVQFLFCSILQKLFRLKFKPDLIRLKKLKREVSEIFGEREIWLARKVNSL